MTNPEPKLTPVQTAVLSQLLALRKLTFQTGTITRRTQNHILQNLGDDDLAVISVALDRHQAEYGW